MDRYNNEKKKMKVEKHTQLFVVYIHPFQNQTRILPRAYTCFAINPAASISMEFFRCPEEEKSTPASSRRGRKIERSVKRKFYPLDDNKKSLFF